MLLAKFVEFVADGDSLGERGLQRDPGRALLDRVLISGSAGARARNDLHHRWSLRLTAIETRQNHCTASAHCNRNHHVVKYVCAISALHSPRD